MNKSEQNIKGGSLIVSTVPVAFIVPGACRPLTSRSSDGEPVRIWLYRVGVTTQLAPVFRTASADWFPSVQLCCGAATASQLHWLRQTNPLYAATLFRWVILCKATTICSRLPIHIYIIYIYIYYAYVCIPSFFLSAASGLPSFLWANLPLVFRKWRQWNHPASFPVISWLSIPIVPVGQRLMPAAAVE